MIKIKNFYSSKAFHAKMKRQSISWEKLFSIKGFKKDSYPEYVKILRNQDTKPDNLIVR